MYILGLSCFYHDSAACLLKDGEIIAAAQEERFTRKKHDDKFPAKAVDFCLNQAGITIDKIDLVAFYDKPFLKFERLLETYLAGAPRGLSSFIMAMQAWLKQKLWIPKIIAQELNYQGKIIFTEHHEAHAASAFYPSPFNRAVFLTVDGVGEWATTSYGVGAGNDLNILGELHFPHSLGLLYSAFTYYLGFKINSGEYKVMGLAPYGQAKYVRMIYDNLIDLKPDGSFKLNMDYFNYQVGLTMTGEKFHKLFGGQPRRPESELTQKEMDLAKSLQEVTEEIMLRLANHVYNKTGEQYLCLAGGVALNCVANGRILRESRFKDIWIQPAAGDAGGALGAGLFAWHKYLNKARQADGKNDSQKGSLLGPLYSQEEIKEFLDKNKIPYEQVKDEQSLFERTADLIADGRVVGWFQDRMEFGPRALGARSILGDARSPKMQQQMNLKIKFRESFRPFAPAVLVDQAADYFAIDRPSPYMLLTAYVKKDKRREMNQGETELWGINKLNLVRSDIPAVTHVDYSARLQTVAEKTNYRYYSLIKKFYEKTGCPVIVNTSFNVRGEPIVCAPAEAYICFRRTEMDFLVLGDFILDKKNQPEFKEPGDWRKKFGLD